MEITHDKFSSKSEITIRVKKLLLLRILFNSLILIMLGKTFYNVDSN